MATDHYNNKYSLKVFKKSKQNLELAENEIKIL